jgi:hypothetical protein
MEYCKHTVPIDAECPWCELEDKEHKNIPLAPQARNEPDGYGKSKSPWNSNNDYRIGG